MYNGSGNGPGRRYVSIAGFRVRPMYLYIAAAVAVLLVIFFILNFVSLGLAMHYGAVAGLLLLIANLRELLGQSFANRSGTALLNVLIAVGLVCAWLVQFLGPFLWIPAIVLLLIAAPLSIGRASVYRSYLTTARSAVDVARRTLVR
ncbi:hypothetical protein HC891_00500 [Candidatus Gracilibacteria bacterium]|nr:hypothetical protein [Candidatus Gracilibacteria bacterium]